MQVVLFEDVKALGKKGDVVKVNDGYARNFIFPKKLGVEATPQNLAKLKQQKAYEAKVAAEQLAAAKDLANVIAAKTVTLKVKVGEGRPPVRSNLQQGNRSGCQRAVRSGTG